MSPTIFYTSEKKGNVFIPMKKNETLNNIKFIFSKIWGFDKKGIFALVTLVPIGVILPTLDVFIPKILVDDISTNVNTSKVISDVLFFTVVVILFNILKNKLSCFSKIKASENAKQFDVLFSKKVMNMNYELLEGSFGRTEYQKAKNALNEYGVYGYINAIFNLFTNLFGFLVYVRIIAELNLLIIPILLFVESLGGVTAFFVRKFDQKIKGKRADADRKLRYINNVSKDYISAKDIRLYSMSGYLMKLGKEFVEERKYWTSKQYWYFLINNFATAMIALITTGGTYGYLIYLIVKSDMNAGDVVLYLGVILGFAKWLSGIVDNFDLIGKANRATGDMRSFLELEPLNDCKYLSKKLEGCDISIENVSYKYFGAGDDIIKNLTLNIKTGEKLAIVGLNGAGKTTLVKLICGLYCPTKGDIYLGSKNTLDMNREDYYSKFSAVFQDIRWMPISILENVSMKLMKDSDENKAWDALEKAGLADKIRNLPNGIFTPLMKSINSDAVDFSGGEIQKLCMARALYKDAQIIILDEPTAALDPIAENEIYLKYNEMIKDKTAVFISHRLSSTRFCDRIIFLKDGVIVEEGTHDELIKLNGYYADLYKIQSRYYEETRV